MCLGSFTHTLSVSLVSSSDVNDEMIKDEVLNMINVTVHLASIPSMSDMQSMQQWIHIDQDSEAAHNRLM
jgi:hypothetical protein